MEKQVIKTPSGIEIKVRSYLTGRQQREIDDIALSATTFDETTNQPKMTGLNAEIVRKIEDKTIETMVVAVDGKEDDILNRVLDLPAMDYQFVIKETDKLVKSGGLGNDKKK